MPKRARTDRREAARAAEKLVRQREKLALLEAGGAPERPIDVTTAAVIEPHARAQACLRCGEHSSRVLGHDAVEIEGQRLRVVKAECPQCGAGRVSYFRIVQAN